MRLPPEIVDHIFSFLQDDAFVLEECAQVHPDISKIVERHLYANITILSRDIRYSHHPRAFSSSRLISLLSNNPHIATYIRSLTIKITRPLLFFNCFLRGVYVEAVPFLQGKLPQLHRLCLTALPEKIAWSVLDQDIRTAFLAFLRLPTLTEVSLMNIDQFPLSSGLDGCQNITRLFLRGEFSRSDSNVQPLYPRLDFLSLQKGCDLTIIPWIKSRHLRSLEFSMSDNPAVLQQLLQACSATVTKLNVDVEHHFRTKCDLITGTCSPVNPSTSFKLDSLSSLQEIYIRGFVSTSTDFFIESTGDPVETRHYHSPLLSIVQALLTLPTSSFPLKMVILHFHVWLSGDFKLSELNWSPLFSPSLFNLVHQIQLQISAHHDNRGNLSPSAILSSLKLDEHLMKMVEQGHIILTAMEIGGFEGLSLGTHGLTKL